MVIIGLLLIALVCLVLGLILKSAVWLVASLIATAGAGFVLYKLRNVLATPKQARQAPSPERPEATQPEELDQAHADPAQADPPEADRNVPASLRSQADTIAADPDEVWVIDGRPRYHLGDCAIIKGQDAEPIPYEQATEDGFMPCSLCEPHAVTYPPR